MNMEQNEPRSMYLYRFLTRYFLNGDAFILEDDLFSRIHDFRRGLSYSEFCADLAEQIKLHKLHREGRRIYLEQTWRYEQSAAEHLAVLMKRNETCEPALPDALSVDGISLCEEQREAVRLALSHRLSIILGGAGTGKTTLIQAIVNSSKLIERTVLCAPTGKAARNLTRRTGMAARTVHSALGLIPEEDFLTPVEWEHTSLVIVDEASMLTLEMLAGILCRLNSEARLVLIGDPNQLLSVGSGNVLPDLLVLGFPNICLKENHRQDTGCEALCKNVFHFGKTKTAYDESFQFHRLSENEAKKQLVDEAVRLYQENASVQVLSPVNAQTELSVDALNQAIQKNLNPPEGKLSIRTKEAVFVEGDRVIINQNDWKQNVCNGDVGILHILTKNEKVVGGSVVLPDARVAQWSFNDLPKMISLAYAITVHRSQGSEFDYILMPMNKGFGATLHQNLIYTAISRAKHRVIIYGDPEAYHLAECRKPKERASMLVTKTRFCSKEIA